MDFLKVTNKGIQLTEDAYIYIFMKNNENVIPKIINIYDDKYLHSMNITPNSKKLIIESEINVKKLDLTITDKIGKLEYLEFKKPVNLQELIIECPHLKQLVINGNLNNLELYRCPLLELSKCKLPNINLKTSFSDDTLKKTISLQTGLKTKYLQMVGTSL